MPLVPSIKGSVFSGHVEQLLKLASAGEISQDELSRRLEPADVAVLANPIQPTQWYDIRIYERIVLLRRDLEGGENNACLQRYGAASAERLLEGGLYQQFDYLSRTQMAKYQEPEARFLAFGRDLRLLVSVHSTILNFSRAEVKVDPEWDDRYLIEYSDVSAYPEVLCWTDQGFLNRMAAEGGEAELWRWERPAPDRVEYRMNRAL